MERCEKESDFCFEYFDPLKRAARVVAGTARCERFATNDTKLLADAHEYKSKDAVIEANKVTLPFVPSPNFTSPAPGSAQHRLERTLKTLRMQSTRSERPGRVTASVGVLPKGPNKPALHFPATSHRVIRSQYHIRGIATAQRLFRSPVFRL
jgi:hypothetical protein